MPAYLYWGEEEFNLDNAVKELRKTILDENTATINHKKLNEPEIMQLLEALQTLPMMFGDLLVEVNASNLFMRGNKKLSSDDPLMKKLFKIIENLNPRVHLLFICKIPRDGGKKIDGTLKLTKIVQKFGKVTEFPIFKFYEEYKVTDWIIKRASSKALKISKNTAELFFANVGADLIKLDNELEKIGIAIHPKKQITSDDLKEMISTNENIFMFLEYQLKGQKIEAIRELHKLFDRNNPLKILATVQTMIRRRFKIKVLSKKHNSFDISKMINTAKFTVDNDLKLLGNISEDKLKELKEKVLKTEFKIKTGELPPETALELLTAG